MKTDRFYVLQPGTYDNGSNLEWYAVGDEEKGGIIAMFAEEEDAHEFLRIQRKKNN